MRTDFSLGKKCAISIFAVLAGFLGFAGISLLADLTAGVHPGTAFRHKLFFVVAFSLAQFGIVAGDPVNSRFRIWLRIVVVCGLGMFCTWLFGSELVTLRLITPVINDLMILSAAATLLSAAALLYHRLGNR